MEQFQLSSAKRFSALSSSSGNPPPWPPPLAEDFHLQKSQNPYLRLHHPQHAAIASASGSFSSDSHLQEAMWQITLQPPDEPDFTSGPLPERSGVPDCLYYMRMGACRYGMSCRFNHPPNRKLTGALARDKVEYPQRVGQPECQYYLKTGTCKFGSTCKYHHPRERIGILGRGSMNIVGFPLRPDEKDCAYYMRTGSCKFGATCKFNHPQPAAFRALVAMSGSSMYASAVSPSTPSPQPFPSWSIARAPYIPGSRFQSSSSFASLIVPPQSLVSVPGWNNYQARMGPMASLDTQQQTLGGRFLYGAAAPMDALSGGIHVPYSPYIPGSAATGLPSVLQAMTISKDSVFPERPGQPECQYYIKTGDCKFGMSCRYHHPKERISTLTDCALSPLGLPLRPGITQCSFYMRYGLCKFGTTCRYDHPMSGITYSPSASSLVDMSISPYPVGFSVGNYKPSLLLDTSVQGTKAILKQYGNGADVQQGYRADEGASHGKPLTKSSNQMMDPAELSDSSS